MIVDSRLRGNDRAGLLTKYSSYKDSGVEWLGEVPEHWNIIRAKDAVVRIGNGVTPKGGSEVYIDSGISFLRSQNVYDDGLRLSNVSFISKEIHNSMQGSRLKSGDILINITGASIGRTCAVPMDLGDANINQHIAFLRIKPWFDLNYISLFLKSPLIKNYIQYEQNGASKEAFNLSQIASIPLVMPTQGEQKSIANYLNTKTAQIDRKIELLSQKSGKYGKLKQSLIFETVTRGLDKSVPMKDSGIEWVGEVPAHWEVKRLKDVTHIKTGSKDTIDNVEEGKYPFFVRSQTIEKINSYSFDGEAILTAGDGVGVGKVFHHINGKFDYHQRVYKISHFRKVIGRFVFYYMKENFYKDALRLNAKSTVDSLRMPMFNNFPISIGDVDEQQEIANYLDTKTTKIDQIIESINNQVNNLKELRKTLINDVVMGKIKVVE